MSHLAIAESRHLAPADPGYIQLASLLPKPNQGWEISNVFLFYGQTSARFLICLRHSSGMSSFWVSDRQGSLLEKAELTHIFSLMAQDFSFLFGRCCSKSGIMSLRLGSENARLLSLLFTEFIQDKEFLQLLCDSIDLSTHLSIFESLEQRPDWLKQVCDKELEDSSGCEIIKSVAQCSDPLKVLLPCGDTGYEQLITSFDESGTLNHSVFVTGCIPFACEGACFVEHDTCSLYIYGTPVSRETLIVTLTASMLVCASRLNNDNAHVPDCIIPEGMKRFAMPTLLVLSNHVGHQLWLEASAIANYAQYLSKRTTGLTRLSAIIPDSHQQFLDYDALFSRDALSSLSSTSYTFSWPLCLRFWLSNPGSSMLISRQTRVPRLLADRTREHYALPIIKQIYQAITDIRTNSEPSSPIGKYIVLNIRSGNRIPINQYEVLLAVAKYILGHTKYRIVFTGLNRGGGVAFSSSGHFELLQGELELLNEILCALPSGYKPRVRSLVGSEICKEWAFLASSAILAIAPWGAGLAKLGWALRIPLIIYGNKQVLDHTYDDWDIYTSCSVVEDSSDHRFLAPECVENSLALSNPSQGLLPNYREDYYVTSEGILSILDLTQEMLGRLCS